MTDQTPPDPEPAPPPASSTPPPAAPPAAPPPEKSSTWTASAPTAAGARPTGITILAILAAIGAIGALFTGLLVFVAGTVIFGIAGAVFGLAWLALAALGLAFAWGAWRMEPWAWPLGVVLAAAAIIWSIITYLGGGSGSIFGIIVTVVIYGAVLYYLNQPTIKSLFGRA